MTEARKSLLLYIAKCLSATALVYLLSHLFHYSDIGWCLVSVMLVLSPDHKDAIPFALSRIGANLVGAGASLACLLFGATSILTLSLAYSLTIVSCYLLRLTASTRSAMASVTIIMLQHRPDSYLWSNGVQRVVSVITGCVLALLITLLFHKQLIMPSISASNDSSE